MLGVGGEALMCKCAYLCVVMRHLTRHILALTIPNVVSNITIPLIGMVDVGIAGAVAADMGIAAITVGVTVFNLIYQAASFLRMTATGVTAQNLGGQRYDACVATLVRLLGISLVVAAVLLMLRTPLCAAALYLIGGSPATMDAAMRYITARYPAIPASLALYALNGWLIGMQRPGVTMWMAIVGNVVNVVASYVLAVVMGYGIEGVAYGTVVAQYVTLIVTVVVALRLYPWLWGRLRWGDMLRVSELRRLMALNGDIFVRTLCLMMVFTAFTAISARQGDDILAANALLMQFFTLFSYLTDGLAFAAESLVGRLVGARDSGTLRSVIRRIVVLGAIVAVGYTVVFITLWRPIFMLFGSSEAAIQVARDYLPFAILIPLTSFMAFIADGIMVGATNSRAMRDTMIVATLTAVVVYVVLCLVAPVVVALWVAFLAFMVARAVLLWRYVGRVVRGGFG